MAKKLFLNPTLRQNLNPVHSCQTEVLGSNFLERQKSWDGASRCIIPNSQHPTIRQRISALAGVGAVGRSVKMVNPDCLHVH